MSLSRKILLRLLTVLEDEVADCPTSRPTDRSTVPSAACNKKGSWIVHPLASGWTIPSSLLRSHLDLSCTGKSTAVSGKLQIGSTFVSSNSYMLFVYIPKFSRHTCIFFKCAFTLSYSWACNTKLMRSVSTQANLRKLTHLGKFELHRLRAQTWMLPHIFPKPFAKVLLAQIRICLI